jgi:hypothetical protein
LDFSTLLSIFASFSFLLSFFISVRFVFCSALAKLNEIVSKEKKLVGSENATNYLEKRVLLREVGPPHLATTEGQHHRQHLETVGVGQFRGYLLNKGEKWGLKG